MIEMSHSFVRIVANLEVDNFETSAMVNTLLCAASENAKLFIIEYFKVLNGTGLLTTGVIGWILLIEVHARKPRGKLQW